VLFLLEDLTSFDIKHQGIKSFVYFGLLIGSYLILAWNFLIIKPIAGRVVLTAFPMIILTLVLIIGPMKFLFSTNAWRTQAILYQNVHDNFRTVEYQMQDVGAFGYNTRTVEVFYLTSFFMTTRSVPTDIQQRVDWIKVDQDINELEINYP
jgi:hypothetical protein